MRRWPPLLLLLLLACRPPQQLGGLRAVIQLDDGANIACVEIVAESLDTNRTLTSQTDVAGRTTLHVGIAETASFSGRVRVTVKGYATAGCLGTASVILPPQEAELAAPPFDMALEFRFRRQATDGGLRDAGVADSGVADAGADAGVDAGADAGTDAGVCDMMTCSATTECTLAMCLPGGACDRTNKPSTSPCDGGTCNGAGDCVPRTGCEPLLACDAGLSCTKDGLCSDAGVCVPSFAGCVAPPCLRRLNMCAGDGGCAFEIDPTKLATSCGGGNVCYANGECQPFLPAVNVTAAMAPWPSTPLQFRADAGGCVYGWDTSVGAIGAALVPPAGGTTCRWPTQIQPPVTQPQSGNGPEVVVFAGTSLSIEPNVTLRFVGRRAVALLSHQDATIEGLISLRPLSTALPGAGADSALCGIGGAGGGDREGGGGGGFFEPGGNGGRIGPANGGAVNGNPTIEPLRGGCSAGPGWMGTDAGLGGGAVQISVRSALRIFDGGIAAPGTGGPGGVAGTAAGGGGSGGAILLQGFDVITRNATLTANGGGGGEGGWTRMAASGSGDAGVDGALRTTVPASGGANGNCCGGNGGHGGAGTTAPANGTNGISTGGYSPAGGGGGGSRGRIRIDTPGGGSCTLTQSVISPMDNLEGMSTTCTQN